jgi:hypothetical protein
MYSPEPFLLSDKATAEGWATVLQGRRQEINSAKLNTFLEQEIYDGNELWRFFLQPFLGLVTLVFVLLVFRAWRQERWERGWWKQSRHRLSFWAWSLETSDRIATRLLPRSKAPEILGVPPTRQLESKAPAANRILTASVVSVETKPAPEPVTVHAPTPVAPAASAKPKAAFVWDESQGID